MTDGTCYLCGDTYTKRGMSRHLRACKDDDGDNRSVPTTHLAVESTARPSYWLHLSVEAETTLDELDGFLRDIWLECCGHLSSFSTEFATYEQSGPAWGPQPGPDRQSMDVPFSEVTFTDDGFEHEYDYGTTSHQRLRVVDLGQHVRGPSPPGYDTIGVYARNQPPSIPCDGAGCDRTATTLCQEHFLQGSTEVWFCDACAAEHDCDSHWLGPIHNSPRTGLCGFDGARLTDWVPGDRPLGADT